MDKNINLKEGLRKILRLKERFFERDVYFLLLKLQGNLLNEII